jgi:hypothetical protein
LFLNYRAAPDLITARDMFLNYSFSNQLLAIILVFLRMAIFVSLLFLNRGARSATRTGWDGSGDGDGARATWFQPCVVSVQRAPQRRRVCKSYFVMHPSFLLEGTRCLVRFAGECLVRDDGHALCR